MTKKKGRQGDPGSPGGDDSSESGEDNTQAGKFFFFFSLARPAYARLCIMPLCHILCICMHIIPYAIMHTAVPVTVRILYWTNHFANVWSAYDICIYAYAYSIIPVCIQYQLDKMT